jgi:hypothetical protein
MPAADDQAQARKQVAPGGHPTGIDMRVQMIERDEWLIEGDGEGLRCGDADDERASETWSVSDGNQIEFAWLE